MKICITILTWIIIPAFLLQAQTINRDVTVDMEFHDMSLKQVFLDFSEKYGVRFSYSDSRLNSDQLVSGTFRDMPIMDFLNIFLTAHDISFSVIDNQIVLYPISANQKIHVKGKVISAYGGSPIPYANISLAGTNRGTSTNEDGDFEIAIPAFPSVLSVSHLAHERKIVNVYDDHTFHTIQLEPAPRELAGITIKSKKNKNAYYNMVLKAFDKLMKTQGDYQYGKAFYRQKSSREDRYTEIFEIFYDTRYTANGIQDWSVQEGRYAFQKDKEYDVFLYNKNFTLLSRMFPVLQPATDSYIIPVSRDVKKYFELSLHEIINYENRYVAVIDYKPRQSTDKPAPAGQLYIDFEDYSILKITGKFSDTKLEIIGFTDEGSNWDNYNLAFEMSFIDDQADNLLLDFIKIDHTFDYYYNKKFIGNIHTSSLLSYYEHYTPAGNKKLGGSIDFKSSDMEVIDRLGYNPVFWKQNSIVKRTPVENKLIADFEQNEAFGVVFMNNDEEVVLLPDNNKTPLTEKIISDYEAERLRDSGQRIFLRLDKYSYQPEETINFAAHIYDKWTFRPLVVGSVLTIEIRDQEQRKIISKNFDINGGATFGGLALDVITTPGIYHLEAYTNIERSSTFNTKIVVSPFSLKAPVPASVAVTGKHTPAEFAVIAESGTLLSGAPSKIVFRALDNEKVIESKLWNIVDEEGSVIQTTLSDGAGIGAFTISPTYGMDYFISPATDSTEKHRLPRVISAGLSMHLSAERNRSIHLDIYQKPASIKEVFILAAHRGRVSGILQTKLQAGKNSIDFPIQHIRAGLNEIAILDIDGNILAQRHFFNQAEELRIDVVSAHWKSRNSNRLELVIKLQNAEGRPVDANLSAAGTGHEKVWCDNCDIRNAMFLDGLPWASKVDFNKTGDSLLQALDNLLILESAQKSASENIGYNVYHDDGFGDVRVSGNFIGDTLVAELNISGNFSTGAIAAAKVKNKKNISSKNETFWAPKLLFDSKGIAILELKVINKSQSIKVNIQGLSNDGLICFSNLIIDPAAIKAYKK